MRLINAGSLELEEFVGAAPPFAILSHTWGRAEVAFQDWLSWRRAASIDRNGHVANYTKQSSDALDKEHPQGSGFWKILHACHQARQDGLKYLWCDTNCIDKSSSAELSEAINSMYSWYERSRVCYAYLEDVPPPGASALSEGGNIWEVDSAFRRSRWFTRGWTVQELVGPLHEMKFYTNDWTCLGTKTTLAPLLQEITGVPEKYLLRKEGISGAGLAQRMSWFANRVTSREEDIAYCMLGIFDVNMPLLYGEGSNAFVRLQEEIIKKSDDHSLFAWKWVVELTDRARKSSTMLSSSSGGTPVTPLAKAWSVSSSMVISAQKGLAKPTLHRNFPHLRLEHLWREKMWRNPLRPMLLAPDPICFYASRRMPVFSPTPEVAPFAINNAGISITLPLLDQGDGNLVFAVLHADENIKLGWQRGWQQLKCIPLVRHTEKTYRYTRTWFPERAITITRRRSDSPDGGKSVQNSRFAEPEVKTIQVCRDYQQVPFYYRSLGCTTMPRGFWSFYPKGYRDWRITSGFVTPGGVFNEYGIFFGDGSEVDQAVSGSTPVLKTWKSSVAGGILVFACASKPNRRVAVFLAVERLLPMGRQAIAPRPLCVVVRCEKSGLGLRGEPSQAMFDRLWNVTTESRERKKLPWDVSECKEARVMVHNEAPLSLADDSRIFLTEIHFI
ncbi:hypothetical protein PpBr36_07552 [Pyricularia pennisetigena]|uniref:hypothetical protein n=1 Tax=Pyricularia pennisetigena TaxID=1578925 RepID=UPI0011520ACA|nr:hypothetical protein PpBr36_07552 [Pyricularia pennisetigena]TLS25613.1 hypothetical protein PpBr36_07552 [Pyricularia pennisetigena]